MQDTLLIEIITEELPPKLLQDLSSNFSDGVFNILDQNFLLTSESKLTSYVTPRRLALTITAVLDIQTERLIERKGPAVTAAHDDLGRITPALQGFARSCGVAVDSLKQGTDTKGTLCYIYKYKQPGQSLGEILISNLKDLLTKISAPRMMRWGSGSEHFIRPVHNFIMLYGENLLYEPIEIFGLKSSKLETLGHRFLSNGRIALSHANEYEKILLEKGFVIVDFEKRKEIIVEKLNAASKKAKGNLVQDNILLNEVTSLVEYPEVYMGEFNKTFLNIPQECLILSMKQHQKYFPLLDNKGNLLSRFLIVSNIATNKPSTIISGNEMVLHARLADAEFFYNQDRKKTLVSRIESLCGVVYHSKLGTLRDRVDRVSKISQKIGLHLGGKKISALASEVAMLSKADLLTEMVGEFPELQGVMGRYYAIHDGISDELATAIEDHYKPRFSGDDLPRNMVGVCVALADKLEILIGMFGIGQLPSGDKDPFALRRHASGVIRILIQKRLEINLHELILITKEYMPTNIRHNTKFDSMIIKNFLLDRARRYFSDQGNNYHAIESVITPFGSVNSLATLADIIPMAEKFLSTEEGRILANANKRITNILKKSGQDIICANYSLENIDMPDPNLFEIDAEINLWNSLQKIGKESEALRSERRFSEALSILVNLASPVEDFFDQVMVNAEDKKIRNNRFLLLQYGRAYMNQVADLSLMVS
ncbi:MAG: glycine--tRNA ligase subunit beta [Nitrosomonadaceae bacterium]|nr:glycine--tRNA ligase subunit beta [Nitrosomonadaceae bacterium]|tara:strand:- start:6185 stop:8317 length:2133 start_codon:yes stop_codon:yes gene_type:complete